ncbi:MAG: TIGR03564 family F420-dependent LLM class oxidoreductase [Acidimicrobiales bacterium]|nr:TIGR03564 family F420-dependent LLM class oxidoreductase [Acidimicrobiales bacterium]
MRISINGSSELMHADVPRLVAHARAAADDGMAGWWLAQTGLVDALTVLALAGEGTGDMELGTAVNATFPIHPTALAAKALTAQAAVGGRLTLGLGVNHAPVVDHTWGMAFEKPIRHMRDYLSSLQPLLETGAVDYAGEDYTARFDGVRPTQDTPGLVIAAMGPQMLKLAGARTDGTILWMTGEKAIAGQIAPRLNEAAAAADRPGPRVICSLPIAVTDDEGGMRDFVGQVLAGYGDLPSYRAMLDLDGHAGPGDAMVCGDEESVRQQLGALAAAGATEFAAAEIGDSSEGFARTRALLRDINARV